jgi:hypothetical protein
VRHLLAIVALLAACKAKPPDVEIEGGGGPDAGPGYVDLVVAFTVDGVPTSCSNAVPACGEPATCGPAELLGPPDQTTYSLMPGQLVEVALLCSHVLERGGDGSADLKIWATFEAGASATVEVTFDGTDWYDLGEVTTSDPELDLQRTEVEVLRFVRISNRGTAAIAIDAVEALR